jgi:hypothetical protein
METISPPSPRPSPSRERGTRRAGLACAAFAGLIALVCQLAVAARTPLGFDESFNLQIPLNLYHHGRYQSWYDAPQPFPPQITTGPVVLLPIAASFAVTGPSYRVARAVLTISLLACLWLAFALSQDIAGRAGAFAFAGFAVLFVFTPTAVWTASVVLGEVPGVCLLLAGIRLLTRAVARRRAAWAFAGGLAIGLAGLAKIVVLICAAGVLAALPLGAELRGHRRDALALAAAAAAGMVAALLGWEAVKLAALGWSGYAAHLARFWKLMQLGGSGLGPVPIELGRAIVSHLAALGQGIGRPPVVVAVCLVLGGIATVAVLLRPPRPYAVWALALAAAAYWGWWLSFNTTQTIRHLITAYVLTALLLPLIAAAGVRTSGGPLVRAGLVASLVVAVLGLFPLRWPLPRLDGAELASQEKLARTVQLTRAMHPLSVFWGFGWRQAPEISFLAQMPFRDLTRQRPAAGQSNYLVVAPSSLLGPQTLMEYQKAHCAEMVVEENWSSLCRLRPGAPVAHDTMPRL